MSELSSRLEAVLFALNEPSSLKKIMSLMEVEEDVLLHTIQTLKDYYENNNGGITIFEKDGNYELVTKKEHSSFIEKIFKSEVDADLTPATMEILSIITYLAPITRSSIEYIRGVNSSFPIRTLLIRGLIERVHHPEKSNVFLYKPTADTLKKIGVSQIEELPEFARYKELKKIINNDKED